MFSAAFMGILISDLNHHVFAGQPTSSANGIVVLQHPSIHRKCAVFYKNNFFFNIFLIISLLEFFFVSFLSYTPTR